MSYRKILYGYQIQNGELTLVPEEAAVVNRIAGLYYDGYMNKLCTRTLYDLDGLPHVRVDEYMKDRLQNKLIQTILKSSL